MKEVDIRIRRAEGVDDYQACVDLQKEIWGYTEFHEIAAVPMLMIANRIGGIVLVAQNSANRFVGFSFALPGWRKDRTRIWWSHMTGVVPDYRNQDIGLQLKIRQRAEGLAEGVSEIEWTFDPLQAVNAHFNIHKLGVLVRSYEENIYGRTTSSLHSGLPTDRFIAEWQLNSDRVRERVDTSEPAIIMRDLNRLERINPPDQLLNLRLEESPLLLEIPVNITELKQFDLPKAQAVQAVIRTACLHYFQNGYSVTDFLMVEHPHPQAFYVLEK